MKTLFPHYYKPSDSDISALWKEGVFILDANVILDIYRTPKEMSADLTQIFKYLAEQNRLWVPYQAALEYQQNLPGEIEYQTETRYGLVKEYMEKIKDDAYGKLREHLSGLKEKDKNKYFFIDLDLLIAEAEKGFDIGFGGVFDKLEELKQHHMDETIYGDLQNEIDDIFKDRVGSPPESQDWLDKIYDDGKKRYEKNIPPGFGDIGKPEEDAYVCNCLTFKRRYADLVIWKQIIEKANISDSFKYIAFVTGDVKRDWWWISGTRTVGPLPELIREISSEANVSLFYMYDPNGFMKSAHEHLPLDENPEALEQAEHIAEERRADLETFGQTLSPAMRKFLAARQAAERMLSPAMRRYFADLKTFDQALSPTMRKFLAARQAAERMLSPAMRRSIEDLQEPLPEEPPDPSDIDLEEDDDGEQ